MKPASSDVSKTRSYTIGHSTPFLAPIKIFKCKHCERKFLNSRALGGHQNAHKKERTLWTMGLPGNSKSIGIEHHGVVHHKPIEEESNGKVQDNFKRFQEASRQKISVNEVDQDSTRWPGSFHAQSTDTHLMALDSQQPNQSKALDLDLHL